MSHLVLVVGAPGTGKTFAARNLKDALWVNCTPTHKRLPFRSNAQVIYTARGPDDTGARVSTIDVLCEIFNKPTSAKTIIVDDVGYSLFGEFAARFMRPEYSYGKIGGYIASEMERMLVAASNCGKNVVFITHPEILDFNKTVRDKFNFDGAFEVVVEAREENGKYFFNVAEPPAKAPFEMFATPAIENDLVKVFTAIYSYYGELKPPAPAKSAQAQKPAPAEEVF